MIMYYSIVRNVSSFPLVEKYAPVH